MIRETNDQKDSTIRMLLIFQLNVPHLVFFFFSSFVLNSLVGALVTKHREKKKEKRILSNNVTRNRFSFLVNAFVLMLFLALVVKEHKTL